MVPLIGCQSDPGPIPGSQEAPCEGSVEYVRCGPTFWDEPAVGCEYLLLDVWFPSPNFPSPEPTGPDSLSVMALRDKGARILHEFNINTVRVSATLDMLRELLAERVTLDAVQTVWTPDFRVDVNIRFLRDATGADSLALQELGFEITRDSPSKKGLMGTIPDAAIPEVRTMSGVDRVLSRITSTCIGEFTGPPPGR